MHVSSLICKHVISTKRNALPQFQEFLLTLMQTKLNLPLQDLAHRFNISLPTAHRIFDRWIVRRKYIILQSTLLVHRVKAKSGESLSPIEKIAREPVPRKIYLSHWCHSVRAVNYCSVVHSNLMNTPKSHNWDRERI